MRDRDEYEDLAPPGTLGMIEEQITMIQENIDIDDEYDLSDEGAE